MKKTFRHLDNEEYAAKLLTTPMRPFLSDREYRETYNKYTLELADLRHKAGMLAGAAGAGFDTIGDFTRLFGVPVEKVLLSMDDMSKHRTGQFYAQDWGGQEWNSEAGKAFRYENSTLMRPIGSFLRGAKESFMRGDALEKEYPETFGEGKALGRGKFWLSAINPGDSPIAHILRGAAYAKLEMDNNFPYAAKNPEKFRNGLLDEVNPLWLEGKVHALYSSAKESAHIKGMVPAVERMISAAKAKDGDAFQAAAQSLYGRDVFGTSFRRGWMAVVANGMDNAEELARSLFIQGHRSPHAAPGFQDFDLRQVPKFFKRGGEVASGGTLDTVLKFFERGGSSPQGQYDDLAYTFMKRGQKLSDFFRDVVNEAGVVGSQKAADETLYLLRNVKRVAPTSFKDGVWDTTGTLASFEHNYREGVRKGVFQEVSDEAFQYAKKTIEDTTQGYKSDIGWNSLLNPSKKFAASGEVFAEPKPDDLKRFWANPKGEDADSITPERLAVWRAKYRTHEQIYDETNGLFSEARSYQDNIKGSIKAAKDRISRAQAIMGGKAPAPDTEALRDAVDVHAKAVDALEARRLTEKAPASLKSAFTKMESALALSRRERGLGNSKAVDDAVANFDKQLASHDAKSAASYFQSKELAAMPASRRKLSAAIAKFDKDYDSVVRGEMLGAHELADGGAGAILEARVGVRSMERQIKSIDDMVVRFKQMKTTPDYLAELKKAEPVVIGRVINAFGSAMGKIRTLQLGNPGTAALNAIDTNGIKNMIFGGVVSGDDILHAAKQNELAPRYGLLGEDLNEHFTSDVARYAFDKVEDSGVFGQLREFTNKWENTGRATLGRVTYEKIAGKLVDLGMDVETASKTALTEAVRLVDKVHVDYANLSPFEKVLRGTVNLYPRFNVNDFNNAAEYAIKNGPESYALTRLRQDQQDGSLDGNGTQFAGGDAAWGGLIGDAAAGMSPVRAMESAVMLGRALLGQEKAAFVPLRILQARYGTVNPAAESGAQALGLAPAKDRGALTKFDSALSSAMAAVGREFGWDINFAPSDPILKGFGLNPGTARDKQWAMGGKFEQAVALREGRILETGDAVQQAQMKTAGRALLSLLSPASARVGNKTDAAVMASIRSVNEQVEAAAPEDQQFVKDALLSRPENKGLSSFIRRTPDEIYRSAQTDEAMGPIMDGGLAAIQNPDSANARVGRAAGGFWDAATGAAHMVMGGGGKPPDSPTVRPQEGQEDLAVSAGQSVDQAVTGKFYGKESTRKELSRIGVMDGVGASLNAQTGYVRIVLDPQNMLEGKDSSQLLNYELKPRLNGVRSGEEALAIINSYGEDSGALGRMVVAAAKVDGAFWRPVYENILGARAVASGQLEGGFAESIPGAMNSARNSLFGWYSRKVSESGRTAESVANWTLPQARAALAADVANGRGPIGVDFNRGQVDIDSVLSPTNFLVMRQRLPDGAASQAVARYERERDNRYPEFGRIIGDLQDASRNPRKMGSVLAEARGMIASSVLPPDFWQQLESSPKYRNLPENVGVAASYDDGKEVMDRLLVADRSGRPVAVNHAALFEIALDSRFSDLRPYVSAARLGYYGPEIAGVINRNVDNLPEDQRSLIDTSIGLDNAGVQNHFREVANISGGNYGPGLSAILDAVGVRAPSPGDVRQPVPTDTPFVSPGSRTYGDTARQIFSAPLPQGSLPGEPMVYRQPASASPVASAESLGSERAGWFKSSPGYTYRSPAALMSDGLRSHAVDTMAYNGWHETFDRTGAPPVNQDGSFAPEPRYPGSAPSYIGKAVTNQMANGSTVQDFQLASQAINAANGSAQGVYNTLIQTGDIEGGGTGGAAMHGLNVFASTLSNPAVLATGPIGFTFALYAGIKSGLNFGKNSGPSEEQRNNMEQNFRINQERLELQRQQFAEQQRQTSIRDIRSRETDLAKSIGGMTPAQRAQAQPRLAAFQRRPTYQSRIGLVDAVERAVGSAIKPRW